MFHPLPAALLILTALAAGCTSPSGTTTGADPSPVSASTRTATLWVNGMSCPLCANNLDKQLARLEGVQNVAVDLGQGTVTVALAGPTTPTERQFADAVKESGFTLVRVEMP